MEIGRRKMDTYAVRLGFRAYFQHLHGIYSVFASVCVCVCALPGTHRSLTFCCCVTVVTLWLRDVAVLLVR